MDKLRSLGAVKKHPTVPNSAPCLSLPATKKTFEEQDDEDRGSREVKEERTCHVLVLPEGRILLKATEFKEEQLISGLYDVCDFSGKVTHQIAEGLLRAIGPAAFELEWTGCARGSEYVYESIEDHETRSNKERKVLLTKSDEPWYQTVLPLGEPGYLHLTTLCEAWCSSVREARFPLFLDVRLRISWTRFFMPRVTPEQLLDWGMDPGNLYFWLDPINDFETANAMLGPKLVHQLLGLTWTAVCAEPGDASSHHV